MSEQVKQHPSVKDVNRPNLPQNQGNTVSEDRAHVTSGPQSATRFNSPAPFSQKRKKGN